MIKYTGTVAVNWHSVEISSFHFDKPYLQSAKIDALEWAIQRLQYELEQTKLAEAEGGS